jgi:hypothetical protein
MTRNTLLEERLREWRAAEEAEAQTDPASPEHRAAVARTRRARHAYESEAVRQADANGGLAQGGLRMRTQRRSGVPAKDR